MKNLVEEKEYEMAAEIADTINWKKIKNAAVLLMVGEIYDRNRQYEISHEILLMAYDRATVRRNIIYRLTLVALKMGDIEEAKEYYEEFLDVAPYDNLKYVLRYQIAKMEGASLEKQIEILEEFKERDYSEEWAFELAYLYHCMDNGERCVEVCDELVLWFGDGKYVEKALELKMFYQPLNKEQEEKYRRFKRYQEEIEEVYPEDITASEEIIHENVQIKNISSNSGQLNTINLQEELEKNMQQILNANTKEIVSDTMDNIKRIVEDIPYLQISQEEAITEEPYGHIETDEEIDGSLKTEFKEMLEEDWDGQVQSSVPEGDLYESQVNDQMEIEDVLAEWERTKFVAETAMAVAQERKLQSAKARALQEAQELMVRLNEIIPKLNAGITPQELLAECYLQKEEEIPFTIEEQETEEVYPEELPPEEVFSIEEQETEEVYPEELPPEEMFYMEEQETEEVYPEELPPEEVFSIEEQETEEVYPEELPPEELFSIEEQETEEVYPEELPPEEMFYMEEQETEEVYPEELSPEEMFYMEEQETEEVYPEELPPEELFSIEEQETEEVYPEELSPEEEEQPQELEQEEWEEQFQELEQEEWEEQPQQLEQEEWEEQLQQEKQEEWEEQPQQLEQEEWEEQFQELEQEEWEEQFQELEQEEWEEQPQQLEQEEWEEQSENLEKQEWDVQPENQEWDVQPENQEWDIQFGEQEIEEYSDNWKEQEEIEEKSYSLKNLIDQHVIEKSLEIEEHLVKEKKDAESYLESVFKAAKASREEKNYVPKIEIDIPKIEIEPEEEPIKKLNEEQKKIFSYFVPVVGMEQQICQVLEGALHRKGKDNSSVSGNIIITGGRGSGKTVLATDIIKAIQKSDKSSTGKVGRITGDSLNHKDLNQLIKKMAGGYLIIEKAGEISQETVGKLSFLMEQNTEGLLIIMEDTRKDMEKLLNQNVNFAKKFTERVKIPVFTSDELVVFAKAYALEQECEIDDMGILALYNRISNIQKLDEATTLTEVKEIVDDAISNAERGGLKKLFGRKKISPEGYLYLREKDFED